MTHQARQVPLSELRAPEHPIRITPAMQDAHDELVASIKAHGLLQDLVVREADEAGTFNVVAGNRRFAALRALAGRGDLQADAPIACTVLVNGVSDHEAALAENVVRVAMHPADQAIAFQQLAERGATLEEIANRFGTGKRVVARRIRLAELAPPIMAAYREGKLKEELAHAFACTADHERQLRVFGDLENWDDHDLAYYGTRGIVDALHEDRASSESPAARFVGVDAYCAAGGSTEEMLFTDETVLLDVGILERLVDEKLQAAAEQFSGWKWVLHTAGDEWKIRQGKGRIWPKPVPYTAEEQAALDTLNAAVAPLRDSTDWDALSDDEAAKVRQELNGHLNQIRHIEGARGSRAAWTPEQKAAAGVLLYVDRDGSLGVVEGLLREGDTNPDAKPVEAGDAAGDGAAAAGVGAGSAQPAKKKPDAQPQAVRDTVTTLRGAVLRHALAHNDQMALDLMTFHLVLTMSREIGGNDSEHSYYSSARLLNIGRDHVVEPEAKGASEPVTEYCAKPSVDLSWLDSKQSRAEQFATYLKLPMHLRADLMACAVAHTLIPQLGGSRDVYDVIAGELEIDFAEELTAADPEVWNVDMHWSRLRKDQIVAECRPYLGDEWATEAAKLKKRDLAADAAERMKAHAAYLPAGFVHRPPAAAESLDNGSE